MAEPKYAYRFCPCHSYDIEGIQTWLEDLAAEGLILTKESAFVGFLTFARTAPRRFRYRLEAIRKNNGLFGRSNSVSEFHEIAAQFGWEFVCEYGTFQIFRTDDPQARELNTDPTIQAATLKQLGNQQIANLFFALIYVILMSLLRHWSWFRFFYSSIAVGPLATTLFLLFWASILFMSAFNLYQLYRLRRKLRQGLLNGRKTPGIWSWLRTLPGAILCICFVLWVHSLTLVAPIHDLSEYPQDPPFVTLTDLANQEDAAEYDTFMDDFYNKYTLFSRSVSPVNIEWKENITFTRPDGSTYSGHMILTYHETCGEWFARGLADDYYAKERARYNKFQDLEAPDLGVDSIRVYSSYNLYVLIQHDNIVVEAVISLNDSTDDPAWLRWAEAMSQLLLEGGV